MKFTQIRRHTHMLIASILWLTISSTYADQTWDGGDADDNFWNSADNWGANTPPNWGNSLNFVGNTRNSAVNDLAAATGIGGINFTNDGSAGNTNSFTLSGASINLNSNITTTAITTGPTITDEISLNMNMNGGGRTVTTGLGHDLTIAGIISGGFSFNKLGAGTLTLSNLNTFSNNFLVTAGTVNANTIISSGSASSVGTSQNIMFASTNGESAVNYTGAATNITTKFLALGTGNGVAGGQFEGLVGRLNNNGTGAMVFTSANLNAIFTGVLTTTARTLVLGGANTDANSVGILRDNGTPGAGGNASINLRKEDAGTWILRSANTYTGTTTINGGILKVNNNLALQNSALVTTGAGFLTFESGITTPTIGGLSGASGNLATIFSSGYGSITALTLNPQSGISVSYGGLISNGSGAMPLIKTGAGNQTLTGNNTFSGAVTISNGSITVNSMKNLGVAQPLGGGVDPLGAGRIDISNGGTLIYNGTGDTSNRTFICNGATGTIDASNPSGKLTLTGLWYRTAAANSTYALKGTGLAELTQKIGTGAGGGTTTVTKSGTGTWILSVVPGQDSTYAGGTNVNEGTLLATVVEALPSYSTVGKVAVASGATLAVRGGTGGWTSAQINSLLTPANFVAGSNLGIDVNDLDSFTYANNIGTTQAAKGLVKSGLGTLTLSTNNTYTGATNVDAGTLEITGATQATSSITVDSGAKLGLTIGSPVTAANAAVDLTNGTVKVSGTTGAPSNTLMTASSIVPLNPVLASPIPGYQLVVVGGTELQLNQTVVGSPEIAVEQNLVDIPNSSGTKDFGTATIGSNNDLVFTIRNTGAAALNLSGSPLVAISGHPDFTVTVQPASNPVPATSGSTTFTVRFTPQAAGARSATISIANDDSDEGPFTFTLNGIGQTPYAAWAGGAPFGGDANGDGVKDGIAFLLGAATPGTNALGLLPTVSQSGGKLILTFDCLATADRGTSSVLNLQYDGDLVAPWISAAVPGAVGNTTVGKVNFVATANGDLIHIVATIDDATEAASGKLFGRLEGSQP